ncbi:MAG: hypothetical protein WCO56_25110 [Verrucomicrobiota bacterium]
MMKKTLLHLLIAACTVIGFSLAVSAQTNSLPVPPGVQANEKQSLVLTSGKFLHPGLYHSWGTLTMFRGAAE